MIIGITYDSLQHVPNSTRKQKNDEASQKIVVAINYEVKDDRSKYKHEVVQSYISTYRLCRRGHLITVTAWKLNPIYIKMTIAQHNHVVQVGFQLYLQ